MAPAAKTRSNDKGAFWPPFLAAALLLVVAGFAAADSPGYRQAFVEQVQRFANLNRLKIDRLNRDVHADCYIPLVVATTLRSDTNPLTYTYARFDVSGVQRPVLHAKLSFRNPQVNLSADAREVRIVPDSNWNEHTITFGRGHECSNT